MSGIAITQQGIYSFPDRHVGRADKKTADTCGDYRNGHDKENAGISPISSLDYFYLIHRGRMLHVISVFFAIVPSRAFLRKPPGGMKFTFFV